MARIVRGWPTWLALAQTALTFDGGELDKRLDGLVTGITSFGVQLLGSFGLASKLEGTGSSGTDEFSADLGRTS